MGSPLERQQTKLSSDAKLPADNWLGRRVNSAKSHQDSVNAIAAGLAKMGSLLLEGRISTDLFVSSDSNLRGTNPSEDVAKLQFGISPTGAAKNWHSHDLWSPDMAMGIRVSLRDHYDYSKKQVGPQPTGITELALHVRTWGKLSDQEQEAVSAVPDAWVSYGDNGFNRWGTSVSVTRQPDEKLTVLEAETVLAPLSQHIIDYFNILNLHPPRHTPRAGNFSTGPDTTPHISDAQLAKAIQQAALGITQLS